MTRFKLYGVPGSPFLRSALLGFHEKAVDYRLQVMTVGESKTPEHLARHAFGRVPVMDHLTERGDFRLYETQAILRYLDAVAPGPALRPTDARALARMDQLAGVSDWYLFPQATVAICAERLFAERFWGRPTDEKRVAEALPAARVCVFEIDRLKGSAPFLTGDQLSIADLMIAPQLAYLAATPEGAMLSETGLGEWLKRMTARPSFRATEPEALLQAA